MEHWSATYTLVARRKNHEFTLRKPQSDRLLGMIGKPELFLIVDYCSKHLEMWHWLTGIVTYFYREKISVQDPTYLNVYDEATKSGKAVNKWLVESLPQLHKEALDIHASENVGHTDGDV